MCVFMYKPQLEKDDLYSGISTNTKREPIIKYLLIQVRRESKVSQSQYN